MTSPKTLKTILITGFALLLVTLVVRPILIVNASSATVRPAD